MADADNYKIIIKDLALFVRNVQLSPAVRMGHVKALEKTSCKYPIRRVEVKVDTVPRGNMNYVQDNMINFVALNVDGRQISAKPLQPDFENAKKKKLKKEEKKEG
jgi:acyl-CoA hydrolase